MQLYRSWDRLVAVLAVVAINAVRSWYYFNSFRLSINFFVFILKMRILVKKILEVYLDTCFYTKMHIDNIFKLFVILFWITARVISYVNRKQITPARSFGTLNGRTKEKKNEQNRALKSTFQKPNLWKKYWAAINYAGSIQLISNTY